MDIYDDDSSSDYDYGGPMCDLRSTLLHDAAAAKDLISVRSLLNNGADINARDGQSRTVLQRAAMVNGNTDVVQLLLNSGADVNSMRGPRGTTLQHAVWGNDKNILQILLDHGTQVNPEISGLDRNALHDAAELGRTDIVELLLRAGANVNAYRANRKGVLRVSP